MAAVDVGARGGPPVPAADDLDALFNNDVANVLEDVDNSANNAIHSRSAGRQNGIENSAGLGIDEEIKVTKKRAPVAKLDEQRWVSLCFEETRFS